MSDIVGPLLQWLNANPELAGLATFAISAAESIAIIGTIVPGSITMTAIGTLAGAGIIPLYPTIIWAILGAVVGDGISYWLGHYFKNRLRNMWPFKNNPSVLERGEAFVHKYGTMSVFIGRFVGPVRALVPLVAGMLGMKPLRFTIANVASAIGWAPAYMLPGILLGAASLELPPDIAVHVILVLFLIFLFAMLCFWIVYKLFQLMQKQVEQFLVWIWESLRKSRYFHIATTVLKHHSPNQHYGQLTRLFYFLLTCALLFFLVSYVLAVGAPNILANEALFHFFRGIRSSGMDDWMIDLTLLGQKEIILPVVFIIFVWLVLSKRMRAAFHVLALGVLASIGVYILKHLIQSPRPWGIFNSPDTFSLPSGHTTLATTIYIGMAFMIAGTIRKKSRRWLIYIPAVLIAFAIGVSRMYLGAHWFTDIVAAWLLSIALLILIILSYHRHHEKPIPLRSVMLIGLISLCLSFGYYHHKHFSSLQISYAQLDWPSTQINMSEWWEKDDKLPALRVSLFGFPSQRLNVEWVGNLEEIKKTLVREGWEIPPARDWISMLHRIADIKSSEYLPLISSQYLDKNPCLRCQIHEQWQTIISIAAVGIKHAHQRIQITIMGRYTGFTPRSYSWIFRKSQRDIQPAHHVIFGVGLVKNPWESYVITLIDTNGKHTPDAATNSAHT